MIVIGYDTGRSGADALALGLGLAAGLGEPAVVTTVHASPAAVGLGRVDAEWVADRAAVAQAVLDGARDVAARLSLSAEVTADVTYRLTASNSAARGLAELAEDLDAGLVVVGSRAGDGRQVRAGTTAGRLLSGAPCAVALAPRGWADRPRGAASTPARIGAAYLPTPEAHAALVMAARFTGTLGGHLELFTALPPESAVVPWTVLTDEGVVDDPVARTVHDVYEQALATASLEAKDIVGATATVGTTMLPGRAGSALSALADLDLLFCGSRGYGPVRSVLLGGVVSRLVRHAHSPVVVVPRP